MLKIMLIVFLVQWVIGLAMALVVVKNGYLDFGIGLLRDDLGSQLIAYIIAAIVTIVMAAFILPLYLIRFISAYLHHEEL